jgi:hypothetical protein
LDNAENDIDKKLHETMMSEKPEKILITVMGKELKAEINYPVLVEALSFGRKISHYTLNSIPTFSRGKKHD